MAEGGLEIEKTTREMSIAVCGLTGAGKSTILNGLIGKSVFQEGDHLTHETLKVTPYSWTDEDSNFKITVYDTPGFEDSADDAIRYRADIEKHCNNVDLLLYCISVQEARPMLQRDENTIRELRNVFKQEVWGHSMIVLTFANAIVKRSQSKYSGKKISLRTKVKPEYQSTLHVWDEGIREIFRNVGMPDTDKIPIIPAGSSSCPSIINDGHLWLSDLFRNAIDISEEVPREVLVLVNGHRMKHKGEIKDDDFDKDIFNQPLLIQESDSKIRDTLKQLAAAVGIGTVTGGVGATIGATIGALAIGIPSFGIFAGLGLVVGGIAGGAVGVATGVGVCKIAQKLKKTTHSHNSNMDTTDDIL